MEEILQKGHSLCRRSNLPIVRYIALVITLTFSAAALISCSFPSGLVRNSREESHSALQKELLSLKPHLAAECYTLDESEARVLLMTRNSTVLSAGRSYENAQDKWSKRWRRYFPTLGFSTSVVTNLEEVSSIKLDDLNLFARLIVNIPEPTRAYAEIAGSKLELLNSEFAYVTAQRKSLLELKEVYLAYQIITKYETRFDSGVKKVQPPVVNNLSQQREELSSHHLNKISTELKRLLDLEGREHYFPGKNTRTSTLPTTQYILSKKPEYFMEEYLKGASFALSSARLRSLGAKLQNFPRLSLSFNSQPLYTSNSDQGFNQEALRLTQANLSAGSSYNPDIWFLDSNRRVGDQLEQTWETEMSTMKNLYLKVIESQRALKYLSMQNMAIEKSIASGKYVTLAGLKNSFQVLLNNHLKINRIKLELILGNEELYEKYSS